MRRHKIITGRREIRKYNGSKGRSKKLIAMRDQKLIIRYYYWSEIIRTRFDDVLELLSAEFFIAPQTIIQRLNAMDDELNELYNTRPSYNEIRTLCHPFVCDATRAQIDKYENR